MPSAPQPASARRDHAERHVFSALPELPALERRVLALLDLAGADRAAAARDTGLDDVPLRFAAKRARKALRRTAAPLSAGARCERAELLHSDRLDVPLRREDRKWLEIHLARCPRCTEHAAMLDEARAELRAAFSAEPEPPPAAPASEPPDERAQLRVVPEPPADEPVANPPAPAPVGGETRLTDGSDRPTPAEPPAAKAPPAPAVPSPRPRGVPSPAARRALRILAIVVVCAGIIAGIGAAVAALDDDKVQVAPWTQPDAPEVRPAPLIDQ
jgi:hypothetical protein